MQPIGFERLLSECSKGLLSDVNMLLTRTDEDKLKWADVLTENSLYLLRLLAVASSSPALLLAIVDTNDCFFVDDLSCRNCGKPLDLSRQQYSSRSCCSFYYWSELTLQW